MDLFDVQEDAHRTLTLQVEVDFLKDSCDKLGVSIPEDELR